MVNRRVSINPHLPDGRCGFSFVTMPTEKTEVIFTIDSPHQEPLARAVQEFLESHGIPAAVACLPFITALPNPPWGSVAVRAEDAPAPGNSWSSFFSVSLPPRSSQRKPSDAPRINESMGQWVNESSS
jgi:hypothetical protein